MKYCYLDHNILIESLNDSSIDKTIRELKDYDIQCVYSPAHIEEIYKAFIEQGNKYQKKANQLLYKISDYTNDIEFLPSLSGVTAKKENPFTCYKRVSEFDTTERVYSDSKERFISDKSNYKKMQENNKNSKYISTIPYDQIWNQDTIKNTLNEINRNIKIVIEQNNQSMDTFIASLKGWDYRLPENFKFREGNYTYLRDTQYELTYTIEILFRILNHNGYYRDKNEKTSISGTHDVSHAIYATKANWLITTDERFANRCKAVYYYLGVPTEVIFCKMGQIKEQIGKIIIQ